METANTPASPRSLIRRLAPWTAALGLFAGGGIGVYRFATPPKSHQTPEAAAELTADAGAAASDSPSLAKDHYRQLFGSSDAATIEAKERSPEVSNRYAATSTPALPPLQDDNDEVTVPRNAADVIADRAAAGDRYSTPTAKTADAPAPSNPFAPPAAGAATSPAGPAQNNAVADAAQAAAAVTALQAAAEAAQGEGDADEIARGQEPGANPLRAGGAAADVTEQSAEIDQPISSPAAAPAPGTPEAARAAFADEKVTAPQALDFAAKAGDSTAGAPEPTLAPPASMPVGGNRYGAAASTPAPSKISAAGAPPKFAAAAAELSAEPTVGPSSDASNDVANLAGGFQPAPKPTMPELGPRSEPVAETASLPPQTIRDGVAPPPTTLPQSQQQQQFAALADNAAVTPTPGLAGVDGEGVPGDRTLEGAQSAAITIQKLVPSEIQVNKKCTFAVRVANNSQRTVHEVQVRDQVPKGTKLVGVAPKAEVSGSQVTWSLGSLPPGEERIVEMELLPVQEGELGSVATVLYAAQASAKVRSTKPQLALRLSAGPQVMIGQQHVVQIEVSNPGSGDATGVMLLESIPEGVSHEAGPALEYPIGTLKAGQSQTIDLVLTAEQAGRINNVMTARGDANLQVEASCEFEVIAPALEVSIDGPKQRLLERPATYQVTIANPGTAAAKDVQLITQLPKGLKFVSANNMGEYDPTTNCVHWSLAELPHGESGSVELTAMAVESGEQLLQVASRAQGLEDRAETSVLVEGLVALSLEARATEGAIEVGKETSYEVTVVNQGSKAASNVQVVAVLPPGLRPSGAQGGSRHEVQGDRMIFAPLAQLAPKAEAKFRVTVQGMQPGDQRTQLQVTTDEIREPIGKELSTQVYSDQ